MEHEVADFARQNPGVVIYVNARPCFVPRVVAEYREWAARGLRAACGGAGRAGRAGPFSSPRLRSDRPAASYPASLLPVNGAVREESLNAKSVEEVTALVKKLANQSGLDIIRIRKPFHTDSPSVQGQWHPFTNKPTTRGGLRPREAQDPAPAQVQAQ